MEKTPRSTHVDDNASRIYGREAQPSFDHCLKIGMQASLRDKPDNLA